MCQPLLTSMHPSFPSQQKCPHFIFQPTKAIQPQSDGYTIIDAVLIARKITSLININRHFPIVFTMCPVLFAALESIYPFNLHNTSLR